MFFEHLMEAMDLLPHMSSRNGMQCKRVSDLMKPNTQNFRLRSWYFVNLLLNTHRDSLSFPAFGGKSGLFSSEKAEEKE